MFLQHQVPFQRSNSITHVQPDYSHAFKPHHHRMHTPFSPAAFGHRDFFTGLDPLPSPYFIYYFIFLPHRTPRTIFKVQAPNLENFIDHFGISQLGVGFKLLGLERKVTKLKPRVPLPGGV